MQKASATERALMCVVTGLVEVLPDQSRHIVDGIVRRAITDGLVDDTETIRVLMHFLDDRPHTAD
jgi:hypothetical protein